MQDRNEGEDCCCCYGCRVRKSAGGNCCVAFGWNDLVTDGPALTRGLD